MKEIKKPIVRINLNLQEFFEAEKSGLRINDDEILTFVIPLYQREYSWAESEIKSFTDQFKNNESCFLGSIILQRTSEPYSFEIIDGQQRLTTLLNLSSSNKDSIYGIFKLDDRKIRLIREFDKWKEDKKHIKSYEKEAELYNHATKATFNWIVYDDNKVSSETLFQRINIDSKPLSVFDEFKALFIQSETKCMTSGPTKPIQWKKIENLLTRKCQKNPDLGNFSLASIFGENNDKNLQYEFNGFDHDWLLRQFLAICYYIVLDSDGFTDHNFYKQSKSNLNKNDPFREALRTQKFKLSKSKALVSFVERYSSELKSVINILTGGIEKQDLLINRNQISILSQEKISENKLLLLSLQIFAMSFQTWLSENSYDQCALIFKNYYEKIKDKQKDGQAYKLDRNDIENISFTTIVSLLKFKDSKGKISETNLFKSLQEFQLLKDKGFEQVNVRNDLIKKLSRFSNFGRSDLWIADWLLYFYLFKRRYPDATVTPKNDENNTQDEFTNAFVNAKYFLDDPSIINNEFINNIRNSLENMYFWTTKSQPDLPLISFSADIEHWSPKGSKSKNGNVSNLNFYGNLCLLPTSFNIQLSDQIPYTKAYQVKERQEHDSNLLPKIVLTALVTNELANKHAVEEEEKLINFLTIFWLSFISQSLF